MTDDWTSIPHAKTTPKYKPNAIVDVVTHGAERDRIIYDENGYFKTFIHGGDHGQPKNHPFGVHGEHAHDFFWIPGEKHPRKITRELTDFERIQHADMIGGYRK